MGGVAAKGQGIAGAEFVGHSVDLDGNPLIVRQVGMVKNPPGSLLSLSVEPEDVHVFDAVTTERIP